MLTMVNYSPPLTMINQASLACLGSLQRLRQLGQGLIWLLIICPLSLSAASAENDGLSGQGLQKAFAVKSSRERDLAKYLRQNPRAAHSINFFLQLTYGEENEEVKEDWNQVWNAEWNEEGNADENSKGKEEWNGGWNADENAEAMAQAHPQRKKSRQHRRNEKRNQGENKRKKAAHKNMSQSLATEIAAMPYMLAMPEIKICQQSDGKHLFVDSKKKACILLRIGTAHLFKQGNALFEQILGDWALYGQTPQYEKYNALLAIAQQIGRDSDDSWRKARSGDKVQHYGWKLFASHIEGMIGAWTECKLERDITEDILKLPLLLDTGYTLFLNEPKFNTRLNVWMCAIACHSCSTRDQCLKVLEKGTFLAQMNQNYERDRAATHLSYPAKQGDLIQAIENGIHTLPYHFLLGKMLDCLEPLGPLPVDPNWSRYDSPRDMNARAIKLFRSRKKQVVGRWAASVFPAYAKGHPIIPRGGVHCSGKLDEVVADPTALKQKKIVEDSMRYLGKVLKQMGPSSFWSPPMKACAAEFREVIGFLELVWAAVANGMPFRLNASTLSCSPLGNGEGKDEEKAPSKRNRGPSEPYDRPLPEGVIIEQGPISKAELEGASKTSIKRAARASQDEARQEEDEDGPAPPVLLAGPYPFFKEKDSLFAELKGVSSEPLTGKNCKHFFPDKCANVLHKLEKHPAVQAVLWEKSASSHSWMSVELSDEWGIKRTFVSPHGTDTTKKDALALNRQSFASIVDEVDERLTLGTL